MANIKFTNNVQLAQSSVNGITGIDINNKIATYADGNTINWTATQDCFCVQGPINGNKTSIIKIDGVEMCGNGDTASWSKSLLVCPIKKGQVITRDNNMAGAQVIFYGLKK